MDYVFEELQSSGDAWPEIERLIAGLVAYHEPWEDLRLRADWSERMRAYLDSAPDSRILLARDVEGHAFGFLTGSVSSRGIFDEVFGFVDNAFVEEAWRGRGVGTDMLQRFENWCRDRGATSVKLSVHAANELGLQFWSGAGFRVESYAMRKLLEPPS